MKDTGIIHANVWRMDDYIICCVYCDQERLNVSDSNQCNA